MHSSDSHKAFDATGGCVVGVVKHPVNAADFSSFLGITCKQIAGLIVFIADTDSLGLQSAQGLLPSSAFDWDLNDRGESRSNSA
jgi:hypothetical protein